MNFWIDRLLPCCKMREKKVIKIDREIEASLRIEPHLDMETMFPSVNYFEDISSPEIIKAPSSGSTASSKISNFDITSRRGSGLKLCSDCRKTADGYCIMCTGKKYCKNCFELFHNGLPKFHSFVPYTISEEKDFFKKQKSLMKILKNH